MNRRSSVCGGEAVGAASGIRAVSGIETLLSAEQAALEVASMSGIRISESLREHVGPDFARQVAWARNANASERLLYLAIMSRQVETFLKANGGVQAGSRRPIAIFERPIVMAELRREGLDYVSRLFLPQPEGDDRIQQSITGLLRRFGDERAARTFAETESGSTFDDRLAARFDRLLARKWDELPGMQEDSSISRVELTALISAVVTHLFGSYRGAGLTGGDDSKRLCSSQVRSRIHDWYQRLRQREGLNRAQAVDEAFVPRHPFDEPVNVLPYVGIEPLDDRMSEVLVMMVTPYDRWFIDDRVPVEMHLPNVTVAVFDTSDLAHIDRADLRDLQTALRMGLSSLNFRLMTQNRGDTLALAAGEAANISRH